MKISEQHWIEKYNLLKKYIEEHHQLPDKKKVDNRGLLNWWKYNKKQMKAGKLSEERTIMLNMLSEMRYVHK